MNLNDLMKKDFFQDQIILSFHHLSDKFIWVGIPVNFSLPRGQRQFIKLIFNKLDDYNRYIPNLKKGNKFSSTIDDFFHKDFSGTYESEYSMLDINKNDVNHIKIVLPYLLGEISFSFDSVDIQTKLCVGKLIKPDEWQYYDILTNEVVDFDYPFKV